MLVGYMNLPFFFEILHDRNELVKRRRVEGRLHIFDELLPVRRFP